MASSRPYAAPRSSAQATRELRRRAGAQFDPTVVDAFCAALDVLPAEPALASHA